MIKKVFVLFSFFVIVAAAIVNVNFNSQKSGLLAVSLGDVESLARGECVTDSSGNWGICAPLIGSDGNACITSFLQPPNCIDAN